MSHLSYGVANVQGIGRRKGQEDSFAIVNAVDKDKIFEQGLFFAVCDGMGGMADGALASQTAITSLKESFRIMDRKKDLATQLKDAIFKASYDVESIIGGNGGSTVVVGIIYKEELFYASVGDSFLWLCRDGNLYKLNREMNLYHQNYLKEIQSGSVDPLDYQEHNEASALTGFLGMTNLDDIDYSTRSLPLRKDDILLACSDGVGGVLIENDIKKIMNMPSEEIICKQLEQYLVNYDVPNQDNYTAIVVKIK
ncbi:MAG: serine/threonine-protein phosphatase [Butyrivibrio sp.]|uniref:PP2C family protein-serine/threonine phosphatase n=1 Tax=Butyrivibrio sp. TaxID=28121 RepID=UPI001B2F29A2|nr:PP2C family serine/threonine-protein phosphatase [Butyrivibrio sp.]MBO6239517.1 serine/threonine-protein phosphatase [Butyrivibrio sp.]